jgi:hypothetical protein
LAVTLDLNKLLGFKRIAVTDGNEASLARALGTMHNKAGELQFVPMQLEKALGALHNKNGEPHAL